MITLANIRFVAVGVTAVTAISGLWPFASRAETIVSPLEFQDTEGNFVHNPSRPYPDPHVDGPTWDGFRLQELYPASNFSSLGSGPLVITSIAFRPDASVNEPISIEWDLTAINLSTTTVELGEMSSLFEDNYGIGGFTTVLSGVVPLATDAVPRSGGLPHDFDYVFEFQTPYVYDPEQGNLLVEFDSVTDLPLARTWHDSIDPATTGPTRIVLALSSGAETGTVRLDEFTVTQFHVAPQALQAGDADENLAFDQRDLVKVQVSAKYLTGQSATWGQGDWDGAPGGEPGNPPTGDGLFDQLDVIAALGAGTYLTGPYAALEPRGQFGDGQTSVIYNAVTGEVAVDAPAGVELTSINIDSAAGVFTGDTAQNLDGSFDNDADDNIFKATFGSRFGSLSFGNVAQAGLSEEFVLNDLAVIGSLSGGGDLGSVDLVYVPEPSAIMLASLGMIFAFACHPWGKGTN